MIELNKVCKRYYSGYALKDISLSVGVERLAVLGFNGAGKSTLAKIIAGIVRPSTGKVKVMGKDPVKDSEVRRRIGIATHNPMLYRDLTVEENLKFYSKIYGVKGEIKKLAKLLGFEDRLNSRVSELSRGLIQRVAIARAMIANPEVLIMDEATAGLDVEGREVVLGVLESFRGTLVFTTHNLAEAEFCDTFAVLENGRLKYFGDSYAKAVGALKIS